MPAEATLQDLPSADEAGYRQIAQSSCIRIRQYEASTDFAAWDRLVDHSWNGTFLHKRRFLAYLGDRFTDASMVLFDKKNRLVGVFPAAVEPRSPDVVTSHPGSSYGGLVHDGSLRGQVMVDVIDSLALAYARRGVRALRYKAVPYIYHRVPATDDLYALFRQHATRYRCDLGSVIDFDNRPDLSHGKAQGLKKAQQMGVRVASGASYLELLWPVVEETLWRKHQIRPVHSLTEIQHLQALFPEAIECLVGVIEGKVEGGVVLFKTPPATHLQYSVASQRGADSALLDLVLETAIIQAKTQGARYFSFGVSTEHDGAYLNKGLHQFKSAFGAGGLVHEFYELPLHVFRGVPT